jgi:signal peptidase I
MPDKAFQYLGIGIGAVVILSLFAIFGPAQLGGSVTYVTTHGNSMEPNIHHGDLALVRPADSYEVGDVVAYHSDDLDRIVLHRIIRTDGEHFVMQGDNNDWVDNEQPTQSDLVGELWLQAPGLGGIAESLRAPKVAAIAAGLLAALWFALSGSGKKRSKKNREVAAPPKGVPTDQLVTCVLVLGGVFALLAGIAFARPTQANEEDVIGYTHQGRFSYSADVEPGAAYSDGKITTGEPVFLRLARSIDVTFDYELRSDLPVDVSGEAKLVAQLGDPAGWNRTFPLSKPRRFEGPSVKLEGRLDLQRMRSLIEQVERETSLPKDIYPLAVVPQIEIKGDMADHEVSGEFAPHLDMQLDALQLQQVPAGSYAPGAEPLGDPISPSLEGSVAETASVDGHMSLLGRELKVASLRQVAIIGLFASLLAGAALYFFARSSGSASGQIALRYRSMLVSVAPSALDAYDRVVEVTDLDSLGAMARQRDRMILSFERDGVHNYFIDHAGIAYVARRTEPELPVEAVAVPSA